MDPLPATVLRISAPGHTRHLLVALDHLAELYEEPQRAMHGARRAAQAIRAGDMPGAQVALSGSPSLAINALGLTLERLVLEAADGPTPAAEAAGRRLAAPLLPAVRRGWQPAVAAQLPLT